MIYFLKNIYYFVDIPCGLVVRIRRSHRRGRGSIPRTGVIFFIDRNRDLSPFETVKKRKARN